MRLTLIISLLLVSFLFHSCRDNTMDEEPDHITRPEDIDDEVSKLLQSELGSVSERGGRLKDSSVLQYPELVQDFYRSWQYKNVWSSAEAKKPLADSLLLFIKQSRNYGLFPDDYQFGSLLTIHTRLLSDTLAKEDAWLWTKLELFSTDAFFRIIRDIKEGRIVPDSLSIINRPGYRDTFFISSLNLAIEERRLTQILQDAEPSFFKYAMLREALPGFVRSMDTTNYPQIIFPFEDSLQFVREVYARLVLAGIGDAGISEPDTATFRAAVRKYQAKKKLEIDGKPGPATIKELNYTDEQKFRSIAITLDRYKLLSLMPEMYIWVNIPAFELQVVKNDSIKLISKVIVGKPSTPTPELKSGINNMVVYPNWTIPASIISKEILPALKKNPDYLSQKGYDLFDDKGEIINPYGINWAKYSLWIPWKVVQGSGDDNALGVFKFNFNNPYSVYLHDTNQRYLFANSNRALSHGCVRVQKWQQLAGIIIERDSLMTAPARLNYSEDSITVWVQNGVRKSIAVRNRFPLFIVYNTCEATENGIVFFSDVYNEDSRLYNEYFKSKKEQKF